METRPKRILLVDDSALLLEMAKEALEGAGFRVDSANDLAELEEHQAADGLDLILMDVQMPELFGDDIASILRNVRGLRIPIYLFSSLDKDELKSRAEEANIDGFISKRDGMDAMVDQVKTILSQNSAEAHKQL